jgi:aldehyde dehydrogenase (NAD+)
VHADGTATFEGLERALEQGLVDKVGFTGSSAVGAEIGALCGRHLQSPCLELGGKNPMVVMDDADLDLAVEGALFAGFGTAGQRCTSLGTAIVHADVHDEFVRRLDERLRGAAIGDPMQDVLYGPMLDERFGERFEEWLELIEPHHTVHGSSAVGRITRENPREGFVGDPDAGVYYHPTIAAGVTQDDELYATETFGPLIGVARFGPSTRRCPWPTTTATASRARSTPPTRCTPSASASGSRPAWSRSTTPRRAPRRTCPSAATASPATAPASPASGCSTSSRAGSR